MGAHQFHVCSVHNALIIPMRLPLSERLDSHLSWDIVNGSVSYAICTFRYKYQRINKQKKPAVGAGFSWIMGATDGNSAIFYCFIIFHLPHLFASVRAQDNFIVRVLNHPLCSIKMASNSCRRQPSRHLLNRL